MSVTVECVRKHETDNAVLIDVDGEQHWIPLSQVVSMHFNWLDKGHIVIRDWIAKAKGFGE
jgi:hypothetical protein